MNILDHDVICYKNKKYNKKVTVEQLTNYHFRGLGCLSRYEYKSVDK